MNDMPRLLTKNNMNENLRTLLYCWCILLMVGVLSFDVVVLCHFSETYANPIN